MAGSLTNWAGNFEFGAPRVHFPRGVGDVQALVGAASKVRALGTRHSFNGLADSEADLISSKYLNHLVGLDRESMTVTVEGGVRYGDLCLALDEMGYAVHNLASLPHISVAGACATATHGSGDRLGNLATAVSGLEVVLADGSLRSFKRGERDFDGAVVALGALGFVTKVSLDIVPSFAMKQEVFESFPFEELEGRLDSVTGSGYSVSLFTDWGGPTINQVWVKRRADDSGALSLGPATPALDHLHPIGGMSAVNCTAQMGQPGVWYERMPHFRMDFTPSSGDELQSEFLFPRRHAWGALKAVNELREKISPLLHISEIRTMAADTLWLSPSCLEDTVGIHFTWKSRWNEVRVLLPDIEAALEGFEARPHWGKLFTMGPARLRELYPRMPDFLDLIRRYDPDRKFINTFLEKRIFG